MPRKNEPTELYRHFNSNGELLYVGISLSTLVRTSSHKVLSDWFDQVTNITIERFPSRRAAGRAEVAAIRDEKPKYNKQAGSVSFRYKPTKAQAKKIDVVYHGPWKTWAVVAYANYVCDQLDIKMTDLLGYHGERENRWTDDPFPISRDKLPQSLVPKYAKK